MAARNFIQKRKDESLTIFRDFDGDFLLYNLAKRGKEHVKRKRQNETSQDEVLYQMELHNQRFPRWFNVVDGSDLYLGRNISRDVNNILFPPTSKTFDLPIRCKTDRDMSSVLKSLVESSFPIERLNVAVSYNNTTIDVPQKMVLMCHEDNGSIIPEALKHQTRQQSPFVITNIIGVNFDDSNRHILITPFRTPHTRYLHKDWARYQFHRSVPKSDIPMRVCYGVHPQTVSVITLLVGRVKIVLFQSIEKGAWSIDEKSVVGVIEAILHLY